MHPLLKSLQRWLPVLRKPLLPKPTSAIEQQLIALQQERELQYQQLMNLQVASSASLDWAIHILSEVHTTEQDLLNYIEQILADCDRISCPKKQHDLREHVFQLYHEILIKLSDKEQELFKLLIYKHYPA